MKVTIPCCTTQCSDDLSNTFTVVVVVVAETEADVSSESANLICRYLIDVERSRSHADRLIKLERQLLFYYKL